MFLFVNIQGGPLIMDKEVGVKFFGQNMKVLLNTSH